MNARSIHSPLWHLAEKLKPRLRDDCGIERHIIRGTVWHVVRDRFSTRVHRLSPAAYGVLMRMDGTRTFDQIWRDVVARFGEDAPSQDQILHTASELYAANLLQSDAAVDESDLAERGRKERGHLSLANLKNPMLVRIPLVDPDRFLSATVHLVRPFSNFLGGALWLGAVIWLGTQMVFHWQELTDDIADRVLAAQSLVTLVLIYPLLKILHELGHAYAATLAGAEVHEMGIMMLTLLPAPYVDASASVFVPEKWKRALIAAGGMMVELSVAAIAMLVWLNAEPGLLRSVAYDTVLIASVSTLIFNGNPLLRFDAYYIFCDLLELPNLGSRSQRYYNFLLQRYLFGAKDTAAAVRAAPGERFWFLLYAPASFLYRMATIASVVLFISSQYFVVGLLLAIWMASVSFVWPVVKGIKFVLLSPSLDKVRLRAVTVAVIFLVAVGLLVAVVPLPNGTVTRGVVWIPQETRVVANASGILTEVLVNPGTEVIAGDPLIRLDDPLIASRRKKAQARLTEIEARLVSAQARTPYEAELLQHQKELAKDELHDIERQHDNLVLRSPAAGTFIVPHMADLADNFIKRGQLVGYVMTERSPPIRTTIPESEIEYVRDRTTAVSIRFDDALWLPIGAARIERQFPQSTRLLPSPALSSANGGPFAPDPAAKEKETSLEAFFEVDIITPSELAIDRWGQRVWVRFDHGASPALARIYRAGRQLFLGRFRV
jgi:putative peptide zinc metalloprotease protein